MQVVGEGVGSEVATSTGEGVGEGVGSGVGSGVDSGLGGLGLQISTNSHSSTICVASQHSSRLENEVTPPGTKPSLVQTPS